jgi:ubiquinone biosynthesis protein UbiJ
MKCLKNTKSGNIIRVSDEQADRATSEWKFIPKSEWKAQFKKEVVELKEEVAVVEETIAEKQLKRKKSK